MYGIRRLTRRSPSEYPLLPVQESALKTAMSALQTQIEIPPLAGDGAQSGHPALVIEKISDASRFDSLRDEWNELIQASAADCLFLTWEWLRTWWRHLAGNRELSIFTVRRPGGRLVGAAPMALRPASLRRFSTLPALEFLGTGCVGSDYLDLIARPCDEYSEAEILRLLCDRLGSEPFMIELAQLRRGECLAARAAAALGREGWFVSEGPTNVCPFISLRGLSWDSYLQILGVEHRYNFRRKLRRLTSEFEMEFELVRTEEQRRQVIDVVIALHNQRWDERGGSDALQNPALVRFHREMSRIALEQGWLRLYTLRLNGKPAASLYGFLYQGKFYFYQSGFDPGYSRYSVGLVTLGLAIKSAIEEGASEFDLLHGDEDYKFHWSRERRDLSTIEMYPPRSRGWLCRLSRRLGRMSKRLARNVLPEAVSARLAAAISESNESNYAS